MSGGYVLTLDDGSIQNGVSILSKVTGVDLKATGQTTLYTVPAGKSLMLTNVISIITASSVFATPAIIRIGKAAGYAEWLPLTTLTGFDAVNKSVQLATATAFTIQQTFAAGEVVKVDVQTGAAATTLTASFHVVGYLF